MTRVFPQLETGAVTQFPFSKRTAQRVIINEAADGSMVRAVDATGRVEWSLTFQHLSDSEIGRLLSFFGECQGRLLDFTFCDPTDNLLVWSEKLDEPVWERAAWVQLEPGLADPLGSGRAWKVTNTSTNASRFKQTIDSPGGRTYSFSVYVRSEALATVKLVRRGAVTETVVTEAVGPVWRRLSTSGELVETCETSQFGIELEPWGAIDLFGLQVEAQPSPSYYKQTSSRGGIYVNSRLLSDELAITADSPHSYSVTVGIGSRVSN
ncbi:MAG: hypothetical protein ACKV22_14730 [Bryobacteraceae bacterium]